jgi:hypothetical protein
MNSKGANLRKSVTEALAMIGQAFGKERKSHTYTGV